ncbi:MAG TPA: YkgJ family cysteine cluster protein [Tepidisphaeraceae bacterium]|nr:YkgJ family cysteine cluster protein [Tepidisphaeraceae bacterium]
MKLPVTQENAWYRDGLSFTCTQCGNCCTGGPGYVWLSDVEVQRLADHLKLGVEETVRRYCRRVGNGLSLKENKNFRGEYDCIFLKEEPLADGTFSRRKPGKRVCTIYPVRPSQCRTWPFWDGNLASRSDWNRASGGCPGINKGRSYTFEQIESLRTAPDWPANPPTSAAGESK